ncbi:MAG: hypothetical protein Q8J64_05235 [Thermodesulfovibrionales bacterium]|nr:hypothetical protein [Thermodesulfovibrionales bacterium]
MGKEEGGMEMLYKCFTFKPFLDMVSLKINHLAIPPPSPLFYKARRSKVAKGTAGNKPKAQTRNARLIGPFRVIISFKKTFKEDGCRGY